jgi:hypothetical protein
MMSEEWQNGRNQDIFALNLKNEFKFKFKSKIKPLLVVPVLQQSVEGSEQQ